jgi:hypothetical protein
MQEWIKNMIYYYETKLQIKVINKLKRNSLMNIKIPYAAKYDILWHTVVVMLGITPYTEVSLMLNCFCLEETIAVSVGVQWQITTKIITI